MKYPFPATDPPFRPDSVPAADPAFPVRITRRAKRALSAYLVNAEPYRGPCVRVFQYRPGEAGVLTCDRSDLTDGTHLLSTFGRATVGVPEDDAEALLGHVLDLRSFPPGRPELYAFPPSGVDGPEDRPGRVGLSPTKLAAVHPELFAAPSLFTKVARGVLSVTSAFAQSDGSPGWVGRLVGENDPGGQAEAVEAVARALWVTTAEPAVVVSAAPAVVAVFCVGFDHVVLLRAPNSYGLSEGDRLISCNGYWLAGEGHPDVVHGPRSFHARNCVWPVLADPLTDDTARLAVLRADVPAAQWDRLRRLGRDCQAAGDRPRDGRPWLSRVPAAYQGKEWWKRRGGYLP